MRRTPTPVRRLAATWLCLVLGLAACSDSDPFCPRNTPGRTDFPGRITINTQAGVEGLRGIERVAGDLEIRGHDITDLSPLADLKIVEDRLRLLNLNNVQYFDALAGLEQVGDLDIYDCLQLTSMAVFSDIDSCRTLKVRNCQYLTDLPDEDFFAGVERIDLNQLDRLTSLAPIGGAANLERLYLARLPLVSDYELVADFTGLGNLTLYDLPMVALPDLGAIVDLWWLRLRGLNSLESLAGLRGCSVQSLDIDDCGNISSLSGISDCPRLAELSIWRLAGLESLVGLQNLPLLERIKVAECPLFTDLAGV
ncbi:MAG: hypothetical protein DRQ48_10900, partial [Gammaproteobacteria bacterium]